MSLASLLPPIDLAAWVAAHRAELAPPVCNRCLVDGDFIVMIVGGPNRRSDWHYDEGPEFFQQIEGEMLLRLRDGEQVREVPIRAGEVFYLPPRVWHSPQRRAGSVGLVVERKRLAHERDGLAWFCPACDAPLHEVFFSLTDIETDLPPLFAQFHADLDLRTCKRCGAVHPLPEAAR